MTNKEVFIKKSKRHTKASKNNKENLIELKITHILPKYEKSKDVEIYDGKHINVWQNEDDIYFWIGRNITILPLDKWGEIKGEIREMLFKDIKFPESIDDDDSED